MAAWLLPLESLAKKRGGEDARQLGGKASRLLWLVRREFRVPESWILPPQAFAASLRELPPSCEPKALLRASGGASGSQRAAEARDALLQAPLPPGLHDELEDLWSRVKDSSPWGLAVRSSATCEDGTLVSMAGLADTKLGVFGADAIADAIRAVWASVASGRALAYLASHGVRDVSMAVVIQRMVEAEAAGVMFTSMNAGPDAAAHAHDRIVNASFGLGARVVDGVATPDVLRIDARGRLVASMIARKNKALVIDAGRLVERRVPDPEAPALPRDRVEDLAAVAARLEKYDPHPWDVEFACDRAGLWVLQARPVTGLGFPEGGDASTVWSSVNIGEALPGVATPLTWSVAGAFSEEGFRRAFSALGCSVPRHAKLVGNVHGRFYLHLSNFMRIATQVPWLEARTLVELGGGGGGDELALQAEDVSRTGFYARLPLTAARLLREQLRLDVDVQRFEAHTAQFEKVHHALDLAILPDEGLARTIRDVQGLLERTGTVMLTCSSSALGTHLALTMMLARVAPIGAERLAQALTSGIRDLESSRPAIGIMRIVSLARREEEALRALESDVTTGLDAIPDGPTRRALMNFLELYG
ncbi:MAG: PEP/pyruvate-binding domain-containing protein, partial [Polyangiaceae bacterium]